MIVDVDQKLDEIQPKIGSYKVSNGWEEIKEGRKEGEGGL